MLWRLAALGAALVLISSCDRCLPRSGCPPWVDPPDSSPDEVGVSFSPSPVAVAVGGTAITLASIEVLTDYELTFPVLLDFSYDPSRR